VAGSPCRRPGWPLGGIAEQERPVLAG
jgi:hypothetical protein